MVILFREETFKCWILYRNYMLSVLCNYDQAGRNILIFIIKKTLKLLILLPDCWNMDPKEMPAGWKWQEALKHIFKNPFMHFTYWMK